LAKKSGLIFLKNFRQIARQGRNRTRIQQRGISMERGHFHGCGQNLTISREDFPARGLHSHSMLKLDRRFGLKALIRKQHQYAGAESQTAEPEQQSNF
jgi:hypothetical protein